MKVKSTKKLKKRELIKEQTIKELALLLPGFSFIFTQIQNTEQDEEDSFDYTIAKKISHKLAMMIKIYKPLQEEALQRWTDIEKVSKHENLNVFLLGLTLLGKHLEVDSKKFNRRRVINMGIAGDIVKLQELCYEYFTKEQIDFTCDYVDDIFDKLFI